MTETPPKQNFLARARTRAFWVYLVIGLVLLAMIIFAGNDIANHLEDIEAWILGLGAWSIVAFIVIFVVTTSLLLPDSVLTIMAGVLFGLQWGLVAVIVGTMLASVLQYVLARVLLGERIKDALSTRPLLRDIQRAVIRDELKLQALLRLTPLNPATMSYLFGATGVKFPGFMLAGLMLIPIRFVEVYLGYAGKHAVKVADADTTGVLTHNLLVFGGLAVTLLVVVLVTRTAHKAVMHAIAQSKAQPAKKAE